MSEVDIAILPGRRWSLRREWSRAFAILITLWLVAGLGGFIGVRHLVSEFSGTANRLEHETTIVTSLEAALAVHETASHQLVDESAASVTVTDSTNVFLNAQNGITAQFDQARLTFPPATAGGRSLVEAQAAWQTSLTQAGLWGNAVRSFVSPSVDNPRYAAIQNGLAAGAQTARGDLNDVETASLRGLHSGLATAATLQRLVGVTSACLFGLVLGVIFYFRRRMTRDLLRPVAGLQDGVARLHSGDFTHPINVARRDELGELAGAFNGMAVALNESHLALTFRATHDPLTGMPNRASLTERLTASFDPGALQESVLFIDIDDFKDINDSLGHAGGDSLLIQLAGRLGGCVRPGDLVARLGGDEFAIVVVEGERLSAVDMAERVLDTLRVPFNVNGAQCTVSVSIGVARREPETAGAAELLRRADFAMYMAKGGGKGRYQVFQGEMHERMIGLTVLNTDLAEAATSGQLRLDYQPVADLRTGEILGLEALVRWEHPTLGLLGPADFIPLAETTGDIDGIGCWVLETAIRQVAAWCDTMPRYADLWVSVNLSAFQLPNSNARGAIEGILGDPTLDMHRVVLEVTEIALAADVEGGIASLNVLKRHGVRIAIDEFGAELTSVTTLARLDVDIVKLVAPFVSGAAPVELSAPHIERVLAIARELSLGVVAEGIEQPEQLELLRSLGCEMGQGYLLARPAPTADVEALLASGGPLVPLVPGPPEHA